MREKGKKRLHTKREEERRIKKRRDKAKCNSYTGQTPESEIYTSLPTKEKKRSKEERGHVHAAAINNHTKV